MHILWVNERASYASGCERYIVETVSMLQRRGISSSLVYQKMESNEPAFTSIFEQGAFVLSDLATQIKEVAPDLIYVHRFCDAVALRAIAESGIPSVRFLHDHRLFCPREDRCTVLGGEPCTRPVGINCYPCLGFIHRGPHPKGWFHLTLPGTLQKEAAQNAEAFSAIVVASRYMADLAEMHGFDRKRVHVLPLFISPPLQSAFLEKVTRRSDLLLFVGHLTHGKGVDILLQGLALASTMPRLLIHGVGNCEPELIELSRTLGLSKRVSFAGRAGGETLARAYLQATAVVLPSRAPETFGLTGPEAMSYGVPVIATMVGGVSDWLLPEKNGLSIPQNDRIGLAKAVDRIMVDDILRQHLGTTGKKFVLENFTAERHIDGLIALFSQLTGRSTGVRILKQERKAA